MTDSTQSNLFEKPKETDLSQSNDNLFADQLNDIKNDKGEPKYTDVNSALTALQHSQQHISNLESEASQSKEELDQLRQELTKRKSVEDIVKDLTQSDPDDKKVDLPNVSGLDEAKVLDLVNQALGDQSRQTRAEQNLNLVANKLSESYGDKAKQVIAQVATDTGTTPQGLQELAKASPDLVLRLFDKVEIRSPTNPSQSSTISQTSAPEDNEAPKPDRKILTEGVTNQEAVDFWRKTREHVHKKWNVTT